MTRWIAIVAAITILGPIAYLLSLEPSQDREWQTAFQVLPKVQFTDDSFTIHDMRDYRYDDQGNIDQARYIDKSFNLTELESTWYGVSHFSGNGLAHVLLSFAFTNQDYLVVSIEARLTEEDIDGYDPIMGLFRQYEKTIVLATEQDVIGLRTHIRKEPFYFYPLDLDKATQKRLLLNFLQTAHSLETKPEFYNTLTDNCMTGLLANSIHFKAIHHRIDYRILLPGYSDELAYEKGLIKNTLAFETLKHNALVSYEGYSIDAPDFSIRIRHTLTP